MRESFRRGASQGIPVVLSTRVYTGRILPLYANNVELLEMGAIQADNLSPQKARVLLMLAMTKTRDTEERYDKLFLLGKRSRWRSEYSR